MLPVTAPSEVSPHTLSWVKSALSTCVWKASSPDVGTRDAVHLPEEVGGVHVENVTSVERSVAALSAWWTSKWSHGPRPEGRLVGWLPGWCH